MRASPRGRISVRSAGLLVAVALAAPFGQAARADLPQFGGDLVPESRPSGVAGVATAADAARVVTLAQHGDALAQAQLGLLYAQGRFVPRDPAQAVAWLTKAADQGLPMAMHELGVARALGLGVAKDVAAGMALIGKAAAQGYAPAQVSYAFAYGRGVGVPQDTAKALQWIRRAADQNNPIALLTLGVAYQFGQGVEIDLPKAVTFYQRAADLGNAGAQYNLAALYQSGTGVAADPARAFALYSASARGGDRDGQRALGLAYRNGLGTAKNDVESLAWLTRAAEQHDANAEYQVASAYARGLGVAPDPVQAREFVRRAAEHGDALGQLAYSDLLLDHIGPATDFPTAARFLTAGLAQEATLTANYSPERRPSVHELFAGMRLTLAGLTLAGLGVPPDLARAQLLISQARAVLDRTWPAGLVANVSHVADKPADIFVALGWWEKMSHKPPTITESAFTNFFFAAHAGSPDGEVNIGHAYLAGEGTAKDPAAGRLWMLQAASHGQLGAELTLAYDLRNGADGFPRNGEQAFQWASKAAESGNRDAEETLADLYRTGVGTAPDPVQFRIWARKAAEQGQAAAQGDFGYALLVGYGGPIDRVEAVMWMTLSRQAAEQLSNARLRANADANLARARQQMTPDEIARAEALAAAERARELAAGHQPG